MPVCPYCSFLIPFLNHGDLSIGTGRAKINVLKDERRTILREPISAIFLLRWDYWVSVFWQQSIKTGFGNCFSAILDPQLTKNIASMGFDCVERDDQFLSDLLIAAPLGDMLKHLQLSL